MGNWRSRRRRRSGRRSPRRAGSTPWRATGRCCGHRSRCSTPPTRTSACSAGGRASCALGVVADHNAEFSKLLAADSDIGKLRRMRCSLSCLTVDVGRLAPFLAYRDCLPGLLRLIAAQCRILTA